MKLTIRLFILRVKNTFNKVFKIEPRHPHQDWKGFGINLNDEPSGNWLLSPAKLEPILNNAFVKHNQYVPYKFIGWWMADHFVSNDELLRAFHKLLPEGCRLVIDQDDHDQWLMWLVRKKGNKFDYWHTPEQVKDIMIDLLKPYVIDDISYEDLSKRWTALNMM